MFSMDRLRCKELSAVGRCQRQPGYCCLISQPLFHRHAMSVLQFLAVQHNLAAGSQLQGGTGLSASGASACG